MKSTRSMFLYVIAIFSVVLLTAGSCGDDDDGDDVVPSTGCDGIITATVTGYLTQNLCCGDLTQYQYTTDETVELWANQAGTPIYSVVVKVYSSSGAFNGPGIYNCGSGEPGYVELIVHGTDNEFYKSQSGTVSITAASVSTMTATFDVTAVGYYNGETIQFSGSVDY